MIPPGTKVSYLVGSTRKWGRVLVYIDPKTVLVSQDGAPTTQRVMAEASLTGPVPEPPPTLEKKGYASGGSIAWYPANDRKDELDRMQAAGCKWCRVDIAWSVANPNPAVYSWAVYDRLVDEINAHGMKVLAMVGYAPQWASGQTDDKYPPTNASDYGEFARIVAARYKGRIHAYEVWNEPNIAGFWKPRPAGGGPEKLALMLRAAYLKIKEADPAALVLTGGLSPASSNGTDLDPRDYLVRLYAAGAGDYFDAVAHHPYYGPHPVATVKDWSAWSQMFVPMGTPGQGQHGGTMSKPSLRDTMTANGDAQKKIWATETNMLVQAQTIDGYSATEARQAELVTEAFAAWKALPFSGVFALYNWRGHPGFSLRRDDGTLTPAYTAYLNAKE